MRGNGEEHEPMSDRTGSICFVGLDNYPVLNPTEGDRYIGGESVQQTLLAKAFRKRGFDVSMVVKDVGQRDGEIIDDIRVWKCYADGAGVPVVRFVHPRITSVWRALSRADADIYYHSCAGMLTGVVAAFCRRYGRTFVFRLAHDTDCIPGQQLIRFWRDRKIYEYGLRRADFIVAQGTHQVELLQANYGLRSSPINMTVEMAGDVDRTEKDIDVLWVNNLRDFKRPELVLELAGRLPDTGFTVVGGPVVGHEALYERMVRESATRANVDFVGAVPYHEVNDYFLRSRLFVNTSDSEGYPNSFLQAWVRGVPVVSFFDPDGLIDANRLGAVPEDIDDMAASLSVLLADDGDRREIGRVAREFVQANYGPDAVSGAYLALLGGSGEEVVRG